MNNEKEDYSQPEAHDDDNNDDNDNDDDNHTYVKDSDQSGHSDIEQSVSLGI